MPQINFLLHQPRTAWVAAFGAGIAFWIGTFFLPGGDDLYRYYIPFVQGCLSCGFVPYYAQWFLLPLRFLPLYPLGWSLWIFLILVIFTFLLKKTGTNPLFFLMSFPFLGQVWLGQVDVVPALGLILLWTGKSPFERGLGIVLAMTKPQLTVLAIFFLLLQERPIDLPKILLLPALIVLASLVVYGPFWFVYWLQNAVGIPVHVWRLAGLDVWRYGFVLLPLPFFFAERRKRLLVSLLVASLATPFFGVYSYILFLLLEICGWQMVLSYFWLLAYPWQQENAMRFSWILPLAMLVDIVWQEWKLRFGKA